MQNMPESPMNDQAMMQSSMIAQGTGMQHQLSEANSTQECMVNHYATNSGMANGQTKMGVYPKKIAKSKNSASTTSSGTAKRRERTVFSEMQLEILENAFLEDRYPDYETKFALATKLKLPESIVQVFLCIFILLGRFECLLNCN